MNSAPLTCDEGSKTHLSAEDGDVSLWCIFSIADHTSGNGAFKITIRWSHAEYANYEVLTQ
jgi:hypothetical protein